MTKTITLRPEVIKFAEMMELKLRENAHKGETWKRDNFNALFSRLVEESLELRDLFDTDLPPNETTVIRECADVGNFAMFIAVNFGGLLK